MINTNARISIDKELIYNFEEIALTQKINSHHHFHIVFDAETVENQGNHTIENSKKWLGKPITISFGNYEFLGVVSHIKLKHDNGHHGTLHVSGYSSTIALDAGPHLNSWLDKDLKTIVSDTVNVLNIKAEIEPIYTNKIEYQCQYQESHFQFLQRLAKQYNEWFYYDGLSLIFGKPQLEDAISVEYGSDISEIDIDIKTTPNNYSHFSYNSTNNTYTEATTNNQIQGLNELGTNAFQASQQVYNITPNGFTDRRVKDRSEIDLVLQNKQASKVAEANSITAVSTKKGLTVGSIVKINSARYDNKVYDVKSYGEYIITEIEHISSGINEYENRFKALPVGIQFLPEPEVALPVAHSQMASVISNNDPKNGGRVQVRFQWQQGNQTSSWLRVMTHDAGTGKYHNQNRGSVFIPEVGDQVMIGFRYNDPNRPFVLGSIYNGTTGSGGGTDNNYKSIITRSGHVVEFNDTDKAESITIKDKKGNQIHIDTEKETLTINALKDINLIAGENITLQAGKNISASAGEHAFIKTGGDISQTAGANIYMVATEDYKQKSTNHYEKADNDMVRTSANSNDIAQKVVVSSTKDNIQIQSSKAIMHNSNDKTNLF